MDLKQFLKIGCMVLMAVAVMKGTALLARALEVTIAPSEPVQATVAETESMETPVLIPEQTEAATVPAELPAQPEAAEQPVSTEPVEEKTEEKSEEPEKMPEQTEPEQTKPSRTYDSVPLYFQTDYPNVRYGYGTIATSGCSVTSLAMVATYLTGHEYLPDQLADYFSDCLGNNMEKLEYMSDQLQLPWVKAENFHVALEALKEGKVVIALMNQKSIFTTNQHFIVLAGINESGKIVVNDPNEANYSAWNLKNAFVEGFSTGDISCGYSGAWIYDPAQMPEDPFIYEVQEAEIECRYPGVELTEEEKTLLAKMVWVEAQGESFEGQQAIAEVVLNRLVADNFQSSVRSVIYAEGQFRSVSQLDQAKPAQIQYEAVERALNGPYVLPIDVVFFATYPVNSNVWGDIGGHTFCYQW